MLFSQKYDFRVEGQYRFFTVVSVEVNNRNYYQRFLNKLDEKVQRRIQIRIIRLADSYGVEVTNNEHIRYLTSYRIWEIKINNPGFRILYWRYEGYLILLNGFAKRSGKARKEIRVAYQKGRELVKLLKENEYELK